MLMLLFGEIMLPEFDFLKLYLLSLKFFTISNWQLIYGATCMLTVFCCGVEHLCTRAFGHRRSPPVRPNNSMAHKVYIDLQSVDGNLQDANFEYLLNGDIDLNKLRDHFDIVIRLDSAVHI